jgi:hypothetical protein
LWTTKTRGKTRRLERGVELFNTYRERYALKMWVQTKTKQQVVEEYAAAAAAQTTTATTARHNNKEEEVEAEEEEEEEADVVSKSMIEEMFLANTTTVCDFKRVHDAMERSKKRVKV